MAGNPDKPYGLIFMKRSAVTGAGASKSTSRPQRSVFDDSDDDEIAGEQKKKPRTDESRVKKHVQKQLEKALEEDASAFAYDEVYDQMEKERNEKSEAKKADKIRKPKYVHQLLRTAEQRQREFDAREERKMQKELEKDAELHADKEVFVTAAYRKKMEENEKFNAEQKRKDQIEALLDVTKQKDLSGFYRHFLNDQENAASSTSMVAPESVTSASSPTKSQEDERPIKKEPSPTDDVPQSMTKSRDRQRTRKHSSSPTIDKPSSPVDVGSSSRSQEPQQPMNPREQGLSLTEKRMNKLRELLKKRNDEASINEYRKRYFERKSAVIA